MNRVPVYLRLTATTFIWASVFHFGRYAVHHIHPLAAAAWRFGLGSLFLIPLVQRREGWPLPLLRASAGALLAMALTGVVIFNGAMFYGLQRTSAVNAALILALSPAMTTVLSAALERRPIGLLQWLGLPLGIAGVACVVSGGSWELLRQLRFSSGDWLMLAASGAWSLYAVIPGRFVRGLSVLQTTGASTLIGAVLLIVLALLLAPAPTDIRPLRLALALVYMGLFGTTLALAWWNDGVQRLGAAGAALFMNLTPVFAAVIAAAMGQPLTYAHLAGAVLVISGVTCASWQTRRASHLPGAAESPDPPAPRTHRP
ncbi:MAG: DMT family transporter [Steroidobacterales bacterium]